ncbi:radical SAM protein [Paenibacillus sp. LHD-117]|uniref:SPL family radical SAM protein n=1 Tax=Paenibacillus sp. LHD-117 TaxID=3071412 RepID=UPI0027E15DDB|nr:radical SAM protein [Paenibacillus sp. LHD-117]MDQ6421539.1 radical SAM protein [Paenibacillus sp. LHD-117]
MNTLVAYKQPKTLLNKGTGFLEGYSHSLNPYSGCAFACSYCYVRGMPVSLFRGEVWGSWVDVKQGAAELFRKEMARAQAKGPVTIFMSSSTDPYQPIEYKERVTRSLLEAMVDLPPDFLLLQTRSPLVTRDIDLLQRLGRGVRVSMTVETDREDIRKAFSPSAPPIAGRLNALRQLAEAGVPTQVAVAPLLPCSDGFAETLRSVTERVCVDDYFMGDGSGGKRTKRLGIGKLYEELGLQEWYEPAAYRNVYDRLASVFPAGAVLISQEGFLP